MVILQYDTEYWHTVWRNVNEYHGADKCEMRYVVSKWIWYRKWTLRCWIYYGEWRVGKGRRGEELKEWQWLGAEGDGVGLREKRRYAAQSLNGCGDTIVIFFFMMIAKIICPLMVNPGNSVGHCNEVFHYGSQSTPYSLWPPQFRSRQFMSSVFMSQKSFLPDLAWRPDGTWTGLFRRRVCLNGHDHYTGIFRNSMCSIFTV